MNEHLAAWQIAEFILGGLDDDELGRLGRRRTRGSLSALGRVR